MVQIIRSQTQLGATVRKHRDSRDLTQGDLAGLTGLRQATISGLETGGKDVRLATLLDVLAALDLELAIQPRSKRPDLDDIF